MLIQSLKHFIFHFCYKEKKKGEFNKKYKYLGINKRTKRKSSISEETRKRNCQSLQL